MNELRSILSEPYIPDLVRSVVEKTDEACRAKYGFSVQFDFGNHEDIRRTLSLKDGDPFRPQKFPLVWLLMPFEQNPPSRIGALCELGLNLVLTTGTTMDALMEERQKTTFQPVLYPLKKELLNAFYWSKVFTTGPRYNVTSVDMPGWKGEGGLTNILNEPIDAIYLKNFKLTVKKSQIISI